MNKQGTEMSVVLRRYVEFLGASGVVLILGGVEITRKPVCDGEGGLGLWYSSVVRYAQLRMCVFVWVCVGMSDNNIIYVLAYDENKDNIKSW